MPKKERGMKMTQKNNMHIATQDAPQAIGPYSQGIVVDNRAGKMLFVSGQLPIDPKTGKLVEGSIKTLTKQVIDNLEAILFAGGCQLNDVVRTDVFLKDLKNFSDMNEEYAKRFSGKPARQTVQVADLPLGSPIEISCIAVSKT